MNEILLKWQECVFCQWPLFFMFSDLLTNHTLLRLALIFKIQENISLGYIELKEIRAKPTSLLSFELFPDCTGLDRSISTALISLAKL